MAEVKQDHFLFHHDGIVLQRGLKQTSSGKSIAVTEDAAVPISPLLRSAWNYLVEQESVCYASTVQTHSPLYHQNPT